MTELTEQEKIIVAKWEQEKQKRLQIIDRFEVAYRNNDKEMVSKIMDELCATTSDNCEHGRHYASPCSACHEIEQKLFSDSNEE